MPKQRKSLICNKRINQQATQGKNLTQVGRDYVRYLQLHFNSGNWIAILINITIWALIAHGLANSAQSFVELTTEMQTQNTLCSTELTRLTIELAQEVARTDSFLAEVDKDSIVAIAKTQKFMTDREQLASLSSQDDHEVVEVQIIKDDYNTLGKQLLSRLSKLLDLVIEEMQYTINERDIKSAKET